MKSKDKNDLNSIIVELQTMILRGTSQDPDEAAKEAQRLDEITLIIEAEMATLPAHMRGTFDVMRRRQGNNG